MSETLSNNQKTNEIPPEWSDMGVQDKALEPILDVDHSRAEIKEIEATPEDYEKFARSYFSELLNALDNPQVNATPEDEQAINDQIAITADLFVNIEARDSAPEQNHSKDVFGSLADKYTEQSEKDLHQGQERHAERNHRFAQAVSRMEDSFKTYLAHAHPQVQESAPVSGPALPGNVIE